MYSDFVIVTVRAPCLVPGSKTVGWGPSYLDGEILFQVPRGMVTAVRDVLVYPSTAV
jgi:hypothetical protein